VTITDDGPTDPTTTNAPLLRQTLEQIMLFPEDWDQGAWRCGTRACYAGRAALLNGATWALPNDTDRVVRMPDYAVRLDDDGNVEPGKGSHRYIHASDVTWVDGDGQLMFQRVAAYAQGALKISDQDAEELFQGSNDFNHLEAIVDRLTGPPDQHSM
jgi:hypothetical protein